MYKDEGAGLSKTVKGGGARLGKTVKGKGASPGQDTKNTTQKNPSDIFLFVHFNTHFPKKKYQHFLIKKNTYIYINGCVNFLTKCSFHNTCAQTTR
jgi:hypothetical protein